jgi:hypothetical protein
VDVGSNDGLDRSERASIAGLHGYSLAADNKLFEDGSSQPVGIARRNMGLDSEERGDFPGAKAKLVSEQEAICAVFQRNERRCSLSPQVVMRH